MIGSFFNHVLYHSWELILINECKGQGALSEELLEASQYYIRYDREHLILIMRRGNGEEAQVSGAKRSSCQCLKEKRLSIFLN